MKLKKLITICILIPVCLIGCDSCLHTEYFVSIDNNSSETIYIYDKSFGENLYPDTTINFSEYFSDPDYIVGPKENGAFYFYKYPVDKWMKKHNVDTISFFIFSADTVKVYPWEVIQKEYKIRQRYDLSVEDILLLKKNLTYPPSKQMRYMKMFPPYQE